MGEKQDVSLLMDAFDIFNKASNTLESSYKELEKRAEELNVELAEKNNFLTSILEGLPVGVVVTGDDATVSSVNSVVTEILSISPEMLTGSPLLSFLRLADGDEITHDAVFSEEALGQEKVYQIVADNEKKKTVTITPTHLKNLGGEVTGFLIIIKDISEIKRLRESLQRDKRLTAMGEMAASIAHQIRNPLGSIELFASVLNEELKEDEDNGRIAGEITRAVRSLNNTLSNMLLFANTSTPRRHEVGSGEFVDELKGICDFILKDKGVALEIDNALGDATLNIDKDLMVQAVTNLVMNASESVSEMTDGVISISAYIDDDGLHLLVRDNGPGIEGEDSDRVFDPFFTTKAKGTGLGLTVVNNIVKLHGGFIEVESKESKGTLFSITLPTEGSADA